MDLTSFKNSDASNKPHYLLFGHPVEHSWSPLMHNTALRHYDMDATYYAVDLQDRELTELASHLNSDDFLGANITIPYKQLIIDYLDEIDPVAERIEAVNTVVKRQYRLKGYNTDCAGFLSPLKEYEDSIEGGRALVFGTGGASRAIVVGLQEIGLEEIFLVSRNPGRITSFHNFDRVSVISYEEWPARAEEAVLIVNATPLGMYPKTAKSPVRDEEKQFLSDRICYDIVYNPAETTFLRQAESVGAATIGGLEMLIQQGSRSFELWTGRPFPADKIRNKLYEELEN